jgi:hypothetical protein
MSELTVIADKQLKAPKKIGRPSKYTPELAAEICSRLSDGEPLRQICRDTHMPAWQKIYEWMARDKDLSGAIACAREQGADAIAEEAMAIIDAPPERVLTKNGEVIDSGYVTWQRNRADLRLKLLAKWHPKKYGDRVVHAGDKENPLEIKTDLTIFDTLLQTVELGRQAKKAK